MAEVLSQQEIDRLLAGVNTGDVKESELSDLLKKKEVYEYDFRKPTRISKDQIKTLRNLHENFAELYGFHLASRLQTMVSIELVAVDQLRYSEYVLSISNPCCVYIFDVGQTNSRAVLELTTDLVFMIVERLLGGIGTPPKAPRAITQIEQRIIQPLVLQALSNLATAWRPVYEVEFSLKGFETNADFVQIAPAGEIVLVFSFNVKIGDESFLMNLCYPTFALEEIHAQANLLKARTRSTGKNREIAYRALSENLMYTTVEVRTLIGTTSIRLKELLDLEVGDIICLDTHVDETVPIYLNERLKFYGKPGVVDGVVSVKIVREAAEDNE